MATATPSPSPNPNAMRFGLDVKYAVTPGMPSVPRKAGSGAKRASTLLTCAPATTAYSCTPSRPLTWSPLAKFGCFDSTTSPMASARITSPIATGAMYDLASFIQPRIAGSSET